MASDGATAVSKFLLQIPGTSIRMHFQLVAQSVFVKGDWPARVRLTFTARIAFVAALEPVAHSPIGSSVWPKRSVDLLGRLPYTGLQLIFVKHNRALLALIHIDSQLINPRRACPFISP